MRSVVMAVSEQEEWEMQRRVGMTSWRVDSARECRQRIFKANGCSMARRKPFWHSRTCESQMECFGQILPKTLHRVECFGHDSSFVDSFTNPHSFPTMCRTTTVVRSRVGIWNLFAMYYTQNFVPTVALALCPDPPPRTTGTYSSGTY